MAQIVGSGGGAGPAYGGIQLGFGALGPLAIFFGSVDPATVTDTSEIRTTAVNCSPGSLFLRTDTGALYKKNGAGVWAQIAA